MNLGRSSSREQWLLVGIQKWRMDIWAAGWYGIIFGSHIGRRKLTFSYGNWFTGLKLLSITLVDSLFGVMMLVLLSLFLGGILGSGAEAMLMMLMRTLCTIDGLVRIHEEFGSLW